MRTLVTQGLPNIYIEDVKGSITFDDWFSGLTDYLDSVARFAYEDCQDRIHANRGLNADRHRGLSMGDLPISPSLELRESWKSFVAELV